MPKFALRFYGRYLLAEQGKGGAVKVLALDPGEVPELASGEHRSFMTVARYHVSEKVPSARRHSLALMAAAAEIEDRLTEQAVWDLNGLALKLKGTGKVTWRGETLLPDLTRLSTGADGETTLREQSAKSIVEIPYGAVEAKQVGHALPFTFSRLRDALASAVPSGPEWVPLADMVEIVIDAGELTFEVKNVATPNAPPDAIAFTARDRELTVISFSNLCTSAPQRGYDKEFAALYEAVENAPALLDRKVPGAAQAATEIPCFALAIVRTPK